jgi:hypothetical protein
MKDVALFSLPTFSCTYFGIGVMEVEGEDKSDSNKNEVMRV